MRCCRKIWERSGLEMMEEEEIESGKQKGEKRERRWRLKKEDDKFYKS